MSLLDIAVTLIVTLLILTGGTVFVFWKEGKGGVILWRSMTARRKSFAQRKEVSPQESQALELVLETCSRYQKEKQLCEEEFLPKTLLLISRIAGIYYPDAKEPLEKARIGNMLSAFLQVNREVLSMLEIQGLETLTQFRLREVFPDYATKKKDGGFVPAFLMHRVRLMVVRAMWIQWNLFVGEAAIKVYGEHREDEEPEPETLLEEMDPLQGDIDLVLPDEVRELVKSSRKNILYAVKPLPLAEVKAIYSSLIKNIARAWHPQSTAPLCEVRVYDLLTSLADYLEWAGSLSKKSVLNKMLGLRLSYLIGVKEVTIPLYPFGTQKLGLNSMLDNKLFDWVKKYQVGRAAKWSKTIFKTLQKKQPTILFRDVAIGLVKEGGKRWLILSLHDKIADETNKLYKTH